MILTFVINGLFILGLLWGAVLVVRKGTRTEHLAFGVGIALAVIVTGAWHLEESGAFHLANAQRLVFGRLTLCVWPSAFALLDVDPIIEYTVQRLLVYVILILVNGVMYAGIAAGVRRISNLLRRASASG